MGTKAHVAAWRERTKERLVAGFGGSCALCGYDRSRRVLCFHHLDPSRKSFNLNGGTARSWRSLVREARKCVMLCANCHAEVHDGMAVVPENAPRFNETLSAIFEQKPVVVTMCPICCRVKNRWQKYCSEPCMRIGRRKVTRPSKDDLLAAIAATSKAAVARDYGVSHKTVRDWLRRYETMDVAA